MSKKTGASGDSIDDIGYASAVEELENILGELEESDVDVDVLAERVARASELIRVCRERIGNAKMQIEKVVAGLED